MTRLATAAAAAAAAAALAWLALKLREEEEEEPPAGTRKFPTHPSIKLPLVGQLLNTFKLSTDNQTYGLSRFGFLGGIDGCSECDFGFIKFAMVRAACPSSVQREGSVLRECSVQREGTVQRESERQLQ